MQIMGKQYGQIIMIVN